MDYMWSADLSDYYCDDNSFSPLCQFEVTDQKFLWLFITVELSSEVNNYAFSASSTQSTFEAAIHVYKNIFRMTNKRFNPRVQPYFIQESWSVPPLPLSTLQVVGADCYYGLFDQLDDTGVGLTADPFG